MPGTILGIDVESASDASLRYAERGAQLFHTLRTPVTFYLTGRTLAKYPQAFAALKGDPFIDLQGHTYDHLLLKTIFMDLPPGVRGHDDNPYFLLRGATLEQIDRDLARCQQLFTDVLGRPARGLTGPWAYYRGLQDRPDILEIVSQHGFRHLRTFGRNERDCQPVPLSWQPFFYGPQGFPDILEILIHDYQDEPYWRMFAPPGPQDSYSHHLGKVADQVAQHDLVWSLCSHDHDCETEEGFDRRTASVCDLIHYSQDIGIRFLTAETYYQELTRGGHRFETCATR